MKPRAKTPNNRGQMNITPETTLSFAAINTFEKVVGTWFDGNLNNFTIDDANDRLVYNGSQTMTFIFNGVADVSVSHACQTVFRLYKNNVGIAATDTPHGFSSPAKIGTISTVGLLTLNKGDYFEIWAKCDTEGVTITFNTLKILFFGEN